MTTQPNIPTTPGKSRGHTLFDRQAQLHAYDSDASSAKSSATLFDVPLPQGKPIYPVLSAPVSTSSVIYPPLPPLPHNEAKSPVLVHRRSPLLSSENYAHSDNDNVQLIAIHPRSESTSSNKDSPLPPLSSSKTSEQFLETDFPLIESSTAPTETEPFVNNVLPSNSVCCAVIEKAFDYLQNGNNDDNDDDNNYLIHQRTSTQNDEDQSYNVDGYDNEENSDGADSVDTIDLDTTTSTNHQNDSGIHTLSSQVQSDQPHDSHEKLIDHQSPMASSSRGTGSEDNDSDFDNQSHEDDIDNDEEQTSNLKQDEDLINEQEKQRTELLLRQQRILRGIEQEWLRKEKTYIEQLEKMEQQLSFINVAINLQQLIKQLVIYHRNVCREIEHFNENDHEPTTLTKKLARAIEALMQTLTFYDDYTKINLAPIRKALEKRASNNGMSSEDLLSIPPKQFLQILSQVQDLHKTAQSFESGDKESLIKLYDYALKCKLFGSRQDESMNKVILKNEDVATIGVRGNRDRCRLILYPDVIVCCCLKTKLLQSPKYGILWFIPMIDLHWTAPLSPSNDDIYTGDELKLNLKSSYKELEKIPKSQAVISSRLSKAIRRQENEYNLAQSKLQLVLSNSPTTSSSRSSLRFVILFSSAYQLQDWTESIDKTKQELVDRSSTLLNPVNTHHQRLTDSLILKRLEFVKPNLQEHNPHDSSLMPKPSKTYSGTLHITIHSIHGSALFSPILQQQQKFPTLASTTKNNYQFYVAVEIDSYNTFYPYAQTAKQAMRQQESVEFKGEVFQVELEYSLAFRLLIYRFDTTIKNNTNNNTERSQCISKFHRNIETALHECDRDLNGILTIESPSSDLKLKISLKYSKREGTFKRIGSKRSLAVFGKSIEKLLSTPNGCIDGIPRIILKCIEMVDRDGLKETGIYRVCCVTSDLQKLRHQFDRNYHRGEEMLTEKNVHVAANLLKLFFRELPEPLFTSTLYTEFLNAIQLTDIDNQHVILLKTLESLHPDNRKILFYLLDHLIRVSQDSDINMMHLDNLAVVFGPTLMRPSKLIVKNYFFGSNQRLNAIGTNTPTDLDQMSSELQGSMYQCQVVLACLKLRRDGLLK
ncbi:unnamed protein product [Rotaria socialis]|uniref:Rho-GAP domain-containing protein n=1 Tax=Rotaria socialis TaxID=392032 RepID=A0A817PRG4_9BILA|nr:unnamed protein product [Rotaria socialis]CAF3212098.1 unnamed protein product [Rotaria socialis]CAF4264419.1 unnamed protein product [Rotaria socialis]CAF4290030.1 unnamed protein product [Rotaria socialis]